MSIIWKSLLVALFIYYIYGVVTNNIQVIIINNFKGDDFFWNKTQTTLDIQAY